MKNLGLYIHVPFCLSKCRYCDFCSFPHPKEETVKKYISALNSEIEEYGRQYAEYTVNTVYFGGGTPTLLSADNLTGILKAVKQNFKISEDAEITAECNPATADTEYFSAMRAEGFNRLSIGVQSMNNRELKLLGRLHSADDAKKAFMQAREAGFENISADVMFGIPEQSAESLDKTLEQIMELSPTHISLYGLKIEEGTHFFKHKDELTLPDEDAEYEMYTSSVKKLLDGGFERYEISNFAKDGYFSRHNLKYWQREDYLGMGVSAHSCIGNLRFFESDNMENYSEKHREITCETISEHDILCEKIMLGMRLGRGVDFDELAQIHGKKALEYRNALKKFEKDGYVYENQGSLCFTDKGMYISNYILSEILDFEE